MRFVQMSAQVPGRKARDVYEVLADFERYSEHSDTVRSIKITSRDGAHTVSDWEVKFRKGIMRWTEADVFDPDSLSIRFHQLTGDTDHFAGRWSVVEKDDGAVVHFEVEFDLGIPSLDHIIDPIAVQVLFENFQTILQGLLGQELVAPELHSSSAP